MYNDTMQTAYVGSLVTILILHGFFENQNSQPIPVVFGGWFEGSQKDFWFGQVLGGAQGCQKSDQHSKKR